MSELLERLTAAESVCRDWGFRDTQRTIFDAKARIAELERSLADAVEAQQVIGLKLAHAEAENARLRVGLDAIGMLAEHNIPSYAFGDNEAACDMAGRLSDIRDLSHSSPTLGGPTTAADAAPAYGSNQELTDILKLLDAAPSLPLDSCTPEELQAWTTAIKSVLVHIGAALK